MVGRKEAWTSSSTWTSSTLVQPVSLFSLSQVYWYVSESMSDLETSKVNWDHSSWCLTLLMAASSIWLVAFQSNHKAWKAAMAGSTCPRALEAHHKSSCLASILEMTKQRHVSCRSCSAVLEILWRLCAISLSRVTFSLELRYMDYSKYVQGQGHQAHLIAIVAKSLKLIS